jgi:hypothetical protein
MVVRVMLKNVQLVWTTIDLHPLPYTHSLMGHCAKSPFKPSLSCPHTSINGLPSWHTPQSKVRYLSAHKSTKFKDNSNHTN